MNSIDHIVIASPNLESLVSEFYRLTGVKPVLGGSHQGKGTANYLVGLGEGAYIELVGPDPDQEDPKGPRPLRVDEVNESKVVGWSIRPNDIGRQVSQARENGYNPGDPEPMSRKTPSGKLLSWILTPLSGGLEGTIPFLIDWKDSEHPSKGLPSLKLLSLSITHPKADSVRSALKAMGALELVTEIRSGEVGIEIELDTPNGKVTID